MRLKNSSTTTAEISDIPLKLINYIAGDEDLLGRFLALTGVSPNDLRDRLNEPEMHAAILDFVLQDESLLMAFAGQENIAPQSFMRLRAKLPGFAG